MQRNEVIIHVNKHSECIINVPYTYQGNNILFVIHAILFPTQTYSFYYIIDVSINCPTVKITK